MDKNCRNGSITNMEKPKCSAKMSHTQRSSTKAIEFFESNLLFSMIKIMYSNIYKLTESGYNVPKKMYAQISVMSHTQRLSHTQRWFLNSMMLMYICVHTIIICTTFIVKHFKMMLDDYIILNTMILVKIWRYFNFFLLSCFLL